MEPALTRTGEPSTLAGQRALRAIAWFEALKGCLAIAAALGMLSLLHRDLHQLAVSLIGHIGLDVDAHYPALVLHGVDQLRDAGVRSLLLVAGGYALVRLVEAYGLWRERRWGEWLGVLSGALYVPFEVRHLLHRPTWTSAAVIAANLAVVMFLGWQLWHRRRAHRA